MTPKIVTKIRITDIAISTESFLGPLFLCLGEREISFLYFIFSSFQMSLQLFRLHFLKTSPVPLNHLCPFIERQLSICVRPCFWTLLLATFAYPSVFPPFAHDLGYRSFMISLETESRSFSDFVLSQSCLGYSRACAFPYGS